MKKQNNSQYVYGIGMVLMFLLFFAFIVYLIYIVVNKAANNEYKNIDFIKTVGSFFFTVILGTILSKNLDIRNTKQAEFLKSKIDIAEMFIMTGTLLLNQPENKELNITFFKIQAKTKLYFDDEILIAMNSFNESKSKIDFNTIIELMKKEIN